MMNRAKFARWWWMLPLLLLTTALVIPRLDVDGLWYDEVWSVINAGGAHYGAMSPGEIWQHLAANDPDQGIAYPLMLSAWGSVVGWSELATRLFSLFAGLLTIAGVYRLGRDWLNPAAGLTAAALLSVNAFYIHYLHELRVFSVVTLSAVLVLWSYGRIMFDLPPRPPLYTIERGGMPGRELLRFYNLGWIFAHIGLVVGGLGLLYTHYFAATLLLALGAVHVGIGVFVFVFPFFLEMRHVSSAHRIMHSGRANPVFGMKHWWRIVLLGLVVGLLFVPWLPVLMRSFARTATRSDVHERALSTPELLNTIGCYFFNLDMPGLGAALVVLLVAGIMVVIWGKNLNLASRPLLSPWRRGVVAGRFLIVITTLLLVIIGVANAILQIIEPNRARYVLVLWSPLALSAGIWGCWLLAVGFKPSAMQRWGVIGLWVLWFGNGLRVYNDTDFLQALDGGDTVRWRTMTNIVQREGLNEDVFAFYGGDAKAAYDNQISFEHSTYDITIPKFQTAILLDEAHRNWAETQLAQARRVWYGVDKRQPITDAYTVFEPLLADFEMCGEIVHDARLVLTLYARYAAFCPGDAAIVTFDAGISLINYQLVNCASDILPHSCQDTDQPNSLIVPMGWRLLPDVPPDVYSVSVQLLDKAGKLLAQQDNGLDSGDFVTMLAELDISQVPPGDYDVRIVVYEWQTGVVAGEIVLSDRFSHSQ